MGKKKEPTQSEILLQIVEQNVYLFPNDEGDVFGQLKISGHYENWPVRSKGFKTWLQSRFFALQGKSASAQALQDTLGTVEGIGRFDRGITHEVSIRVAQYDKDIYLDLGNAAWEAVKISASGWEVVKKTPVFFIKAPLKGIFPVYSRPAG